ncbi:hypothetical protein ACFPPE_07460 [Agromyces tardus]|uniref:hypothetical protein n=1 Tax=Agromyces tardus TaxID=2583849 RepID=UPI00360B4654
MPREHLGDIVIPWDGRRPYTVLHPNFQRSRGEQKTEEEHTLKRAFVRLALAGEEPDIATSVPRLHSTTWQFRTDTGGMEEAA